LFINLADLGLATSSTMTTLEAVSSFVTSNLEVAKADEELDIEEQQQQTRFDSSEIGQLVKVASEGALTVKTVSTYRKYISLCSFFYLKKYCN
jgi:hypothetical protein